ncbi:MAG: FeoB-associated Cys-rich membrane protein, partial [Verrucomicrobiota bacterium]|nr:FeoB-associated Cys-rich membrane protein [Verrucomicrobiota bacterium]
GLNMKAALWDWLLVGMLVASAACWLFVRSRRQLRRSGSKCSPAACGMSCSDCPFSKDRHVLPPEK